MHAFWSVLTYDLLEDRRIDDVIIKTFFNSLLYKTNRFQVAVHLWHTRLCLVCHFLFLPHFDVICDLLLNRCTATWNLFVNQQGCLHILCSPHNILPSQLAWHDIWIWHWWLRPALTMTQTVSPIIISIATQTSLSVLTTFRITSRWLREGVASNSSAGLIFLWVWEKWCLKNKAFPLK